MRATRPAPSLAHSAHSALKRWNNRSTLFAYPHTHSPTHASHPPYTFHFPLSTFLPLSTTDSSHSSRHVASLPDSVDTLSSFLTTTLPSCFVLCSLSLSPRFSSCRCRCCRKSQLHQTQNAFLPSFPPLVYS